MGFLKGIKYRVHPPLPDRNMEEAHRRRESNWNYINRFSKGIRLCQPHHTWV